MNVQEYLDRLAAPRPAAADESALRQIHRAHLFSVPFENLDIHRAQPIQLDPEALFQKVVHGRRGGFCYELNGLFAWLLEALGYRVTRLSARVYASSGELGPEFDHLALRVDLDRSWLCDVGFGEGFLEPLPLEPGEHGGGGDRVYRLSVVGEQEGAGADWLYERRTGAGRWERQYRFTLLPRRPEEFVPMCRYHQTSPDSPFTRRRLCTLALPGGRLTLSEGRLIETRGADRTTAAVDGPEAEAAVLKERFGVALPPGPWISPLAGR